MLVSKVKIFLLLSLLFLSTNYSDNFAKRQSSDIDPVTIDAVSKISMDRLSITSDTELINNSNVFGWSGDGSESNPIIITGYKFNTKSGAALYIESTTLYVLILDNEFSTSGFSGIGLLYTNNIEIRENLFVDQSTAINLFQTNNTLITSNNFRNIDTSIFVEETDFTTAKMNIFSDNNKVFEGLSDTNIIFSSNTVLNGSSSNSVFYVDSVLKATIEDNIFNDAPNSIAFELEYTDNVVFARNVIKNFTTGMNYNRGNNALVDANIIDASFADLNLVKSTTLTVSNNYLTGAGIKFEINNVVDNFVFSNNTLKNQEILYLQDQTSGSYTGTYGQVILQNSSNIVFSALSFSKGGSAFIIMYSDNIEIKDSDIADKSYGIYAKYSTRIKLSNNNFIRINNYAFYVYIGGNHTLLSNTVTDSQGFYLLQSDYSNIKNNKLNNITINGIQIFNSKNITLNYNIINKISRTAIFISSLSNTSIIGNSISNAQTGIYLVNSYDMTIYDNILVNANLELTDTITSKLYHDMNNNTVNGKQIYFAISDSSLSVVDGSSYGQVILVNVSMITINNFSSVNIDKAIQIIASNNITINNANIIDSINEGITIKISPDVFVKNAIIENGYIGILTENIIEVSNSEFKGLNIGISAGDTANITSNLFEKNFIKSIYLRNYKSNSIINNNVVKGSLQGISTVGGNLTLTNNILLNTSWFPNHPNNINNIAKLVSNNTVNGKELVYIFNNTSPVDLIDKGEVVLDYASNIKIENISVKNITGIIFIFQSTNISINNISANYINDNAITIRDSSNIDIRNANFVNIITYGISVYNVNGISIINSSIINSNIAISGYIVANIYINGFTVINTTASGIDMSSSVSNITIVNSIFNNINSEAINVKVSTIGGIFKNNIFVNTGSFGLYLNNIGNINSTVVDNEFINNRYNFANDFAFYDGGWEGTIYLNHNYIDFISDVDANKDGYYDNSFEFQSGKAAKVEDLAPKVYPDKVMSLLNSDTVIFDTPTDGDTLQNMTLISWNKIKNQFDLDVFYSLYYSTDGGNAYQTLANNIETNQYNWDITSFANNTVFTIFINASLNINGVDVLSSDSITGVHISYKDNTTTETSSSTTSNTNTTNSTETTSDTSVDTISSTTTVNIPSFTNSTDETDGSNTGVIVASVVVATLAVGGGVFIYLKKKQIV